MLESGGSRSVEGSPSPLRVADQIQRAADSLVRALTHRQYAFLLLASLGYFAITFYRAGRRPFWFDEIFTLYIARLPDLGSIWSACTHGVDFNPPMLYLLTHWSQAAFGANELGARIPQVVGFWVFCLCLYRFVSIRTNALAGFIALLWPITTTGYWYASEARSYGLVLGFFGLALISWQAATDQAHINEKRRRWIPLAGLALSLTGAALCHCYTFLLFVPLGVGELVRTFQRRRVDAAVWCALLIPAIVSVATVLPLLHAVRGTLPPALTGNASQNILSGWDLSVHRILLLALFLLISVWAAVGSPSRKPLADIRKFAGHEIACLAASLCTPLVAFCAALAAHAPLYGRYSLITMAGAACLIGVACARTRVVGLLVLFAVLAIITKQFAGFWRASWVAEPSTGMAVGTRSAADNFSLKFVETSARGDEPIVLMDFLEFAAIFHYSPPPIRSRFVYLVSDLNSAGTVRPAQCCNSPGKLTSAQDSNGATYFELEQCCGAPGTIASHDEFFAAHPSFFVYGGGELQHLDLQRLSTLFRPPAGEMTLLGCKGGRCLFHVAPSLETNLIRNPRSRSDPSSEK